MHPKFMRFMPALLGASILACGPSLARHSRWHSATSSHHATPVPAPPALTTSPTWPAYDEITLVVDRKILVPSNGFFDPGAPLTAGFFLDGLKQLQKEYLYRGITALPKLPTVANRMAVLSREDAMALLVKALVPPTATVTWSPDILVQTVLDIAQVSPANQNAADLAAQRLWLPNPFRPKDAADRAFAASLLARAYPWGAAAPQSGTFQDEIRKALSMHLLFAERQFPDGDPVTTAELARAINRARMYVSPELWSQLPVLPVDSDDKKPLTRAEAIALVATGLVADNHMAFRTLHARTPLEDPQATTVFHLLPYNYLNYVDAADIPADEIDTVAVATYKGWIPNLSDEPGELKPNAPASLGYVANLLARSVDRPGDYTGVILDMSALKPLPRRGGMYVMNAGESTTDEVAPDLVYPARGHGPVRPFYAAPGALAYYGNVTDAEAGRAGRHPLVIKPLDWAQYDWSSMNGTPGLRRGGGTEVPLSHYHFVHGTPPLILLSPKDAAQIRILDQKSLLLREARMALVQPSYSMTAMRAQP